MKRYYLSKIIGDGQSIQTAYRAKVADYDVGHVVAFGSNANGTPKRAWCLCLVNAVDHTPLLNDNQIFAIPDATLDSTWGALNNPTRRQVTDAFAAEGIDSSWIKTTTTIREIIRFLGRQHYDTFTENNFDVA